MSSPPTDSDISSRGGLIAVVVVGFMSSLLSFSLLLYLLLSIPKPKRVILPITIFYLSLLFWDSIQGIGAIVNIQWLRHDQIVTGTFCTSQAIIKQLSNTGTALCIIAMSFCILHDYVVESNGRHHRWTGAIGLAIISLIQVVDISLPNGIFRGARNYYGISGYWCWIAEDHFTTKIVTEYLWFWLAWLISLLTAIAYNLRVRIERPLPVGFLWVGFPLAGNKLLRVGLVSMDRTDPGSYGRVMRSLSFFEMTSPRRTIRMMLPMPIQYLERPWKEVDRVAPNNPAANLDRIKYEQGQSWKLLLFPLSYLVLIAPISIVRFIEFRKGSRVGPRAVLTVDAIFSLTGVVDFVLFFWAKPAFGF